MCRRARLGSRSQTHTAWHRRMCLHVWVSRPPCPSRPCSGIEDANHHQAKGRSLLVHSCHTFIFKRHLHAFGIKSCQIIYSTFSTPELVNISIGRFPKISSLSKANVQTYILTNIFVCQIILILIFVSNR